MRALYRVAGLLSLGLGIAGAVLPLMPTVPFLMCGAITFFNANYYAQRVIGDYYIRKAQDHAKRGVDRVELHTS